MTKIILIDSLVVTMLFAMLLKVASGTMASRSSITQSWTIEINNSTQLPLYHFWDQCVGSGHASLALRNDYEYQLKQAKSEIGFNYVRFHGLLDDDIGCVNGINDYSFVNIDNIFDFLISIDMKPFVEISFMPSDFATDPESTVFHYKGGISEPISWNIWYQFIQTWISHLIDRYGISEVCFAVFLFKLNYSHFLFVCVLQLVFMHPIF